MENFDKLEQILSETKEKLKQPEVGKDNILPKPEQPPDNSSPDKPNIIEPAIDVTTLTTEAIENLYTGMFGIIALRVGKHWEINPLEAKMIAEPTKIVLDKYAVKLSPEFVLAGSLALVVLPRLFLTLSEQKKSVEAKSEPKSEMKVES